MYFCRSWFSNMVSFRYVLVFLNFLHDIFSIKFYTISFLCKYNFFIDEKHTQWMLDTKVKVFHESILCFTKWPWNCISWNLLKEKFQSVSFPLEIQFSINLIMNIYKLYWHKYHGNAAGIYLLKVDYRKTRTRCDMFKFKNKNTRTMPSVVLVSLLLTLNIFLTL